MGGDLPHLRPVQPPPPSGPFSCNQNPSRPSSAPILFPSVSRSHPTPQIRSGATVAQTPKSSRSHLRRGARRRRLPSPPPACRPPGGPPWTGGSIPAIRTPRGASVRRRRSPELCLRSARREEGGDDWSNLTSGPKGPTVSDPRVGPRGLSGGVKPEVRVLLSKAYFVRNVFFSVLF